MTRERFESECSSITPRELYRKKLDMSIAIANRRASRSRELDVLPDPSQSTKIYTGWSAADSEEPHTQIPDVHADTVPDVAKRLWCEAEEAVLRPVEKRSTRARPLIRSSVN